MYRSRLSSYWVSFISLCTLLVIGFPFGVSAHDGDTSLIHSCVKDLKKSHLESGDGAANDDPDGKTKNKPNIQIVGPNDGCATGWTPLDWNVEGPPGPLDPELLGRISTLELQIQELQAQVAELATVQLPPLLSVTDVSFEEGTGCTSNPSYGYTEYVFTVALSKPSNNFVLFDYSTAYDTATSGDFTPKSGAVEFAPGITSGTISVLVRCDSQPEEDETFLVNLTGIINATPGKTVATGTIVNDDFPSVTVRAPFNSSNFQSFDLVAEDGSAEVWVELATTAPFPVSVEYETVDGTAFGGVDFQADAGVLTIEPGNRLASIVLYGLEDIEPEGLENFFVRIFNPTNAILNPSGSQVEYWVGDNDITISIVGDTTVTEGNTLNSPATPHSIDIAISQSVAGPVRVRIKRGADIPGTEPAGIASYYGFFGVWLGDVILGSTSIGRACSEEFYPYNCPFINIAPGTTSVTVSVPILGDQVDEPDEVFPLELFDLRGAAPGNITGTITIIDDDDPAP